MTSFKPLGFLWEGPLVLGNTGLSQRSEATSIVAHGEKDRAPLIWGPVRRGSP